MVADKYATELEKAIFNRYYGGEDAPVESVFNAFVEGLDNDMQVLVPFEPSAQMMEMIGNPEEAKVGDTFTSREDIGISFRHLPAEEEGYYYMRSMMNI